MSDGGEGRPAIRALDDRTVRQIAAGEVVERPASVVKELVENSLDADATRISIAVNAGGTEGVRVRDDGVGMDRDDVEMAVEEHTTSKISDVDDLESGVGTLGFRGEALHTIGAVSRLTVRSKPRGGDGAGTELRVEGGEVADVRPAGCPEGTVVEVEDLFYNTPARRKFLKTTATEFDHVNTVATQYALANPDVALSLEHDDREVFATEGRGSLASTVLSVYGREVAESMVRVDAEPDAGPVDSVTGLVSHPETTRSARDYLSTFVNGRYVTARPLREAVLDAYGGQLAPDRYPFAVLFADVPRETVDVNVHPRKMEVRFDDESGVKRAVESAVESALLGEGLIRSSAPRGRSAPDEVEPAPEAPETEARGGKGHSPQPPSSSDAPPDRSESKTEAAGRGDGDDAGGVEAEASESGAGESAESAEVPKSVDSAADSDGENESSLPDGDGTDVTDDEAWSVSAGRTRSRPERAPGTPSASVGGESTASETASESSPASGADLSPTAAEATQSSLDGASSGAGGEEATGIDDARDGSDRSRRLGAPTVQRDLSGDAAALEPEFDSLPSMRVLGQLHDTYVVAETTDGMVLVDQHAADERVNYERLQAKLAGDVATQALADPVEVELTAREAALFEEYREALSETGFRAERTDERTVEVRSVPAVFAEALRPELLRDALTACVSEGESGGRETVDAVADELLADLACYPSVTGNTSLTEGSVVDLLSALDDCENPYACPHGRPVLIELGDEEIADRFERDYPGHGGRRAE
ncbi:DNA mismatch repair endonuclease MutL [Halogeometricum luteum]|uniref:DNA mismatch repair protein MutL n=1 Tax=Halogeometricum luteum TaxID=2950537 RepID=A0ABU2G625_9EURY|nr:DNA mismatch repair endonuclease MutL [Halogeometricum sp. S3BR5-2]MDS0296235.1 DNA mismatch repair endonuclease MutL [Halogeometricum sp. S3BR5-2]